MIARITIAEPNFSITNNSAYIVRITLGNGLGGDGGSVTWDNVTDKPTDLVQDADYNHTDNNFTDAEQTKLSGLAAQVQSNLEQTDTGAVDFVKGKNIIPAAQIQSDLLQSNTGALDYVKNKLESFIVSASNFDTSITTGVYKAYIFVPYAFYITAVEAAMATAPVGSSAIFDLTVDAVSILSTPITIETGENTSYTATVQPVVSTHNVAAGKFILVAFTQVGASTPGKDVEITVKGYRV